MKALLPLALGLSLSAVAQAQVSNVQNVDSVSATSTFNGIALRISEIRIDQGGSDANEFFEIEGTPNVSLAGLTYLVIGDATGDGAGGGLDAVIPLTGSTGASGYYVGSEDSYSLSTPDETFGATGVNFENSDNVTHMLVEGWTGVAGMDLDVDDDGVIDTPAPWTNVLDSITLLETPGTGDLVYGPNSIGPDGTFVPAHVYRCAGTWTIGNFGPLGSSDTPGYGGCNTPLVSTFCDPANNNSTGFPGVLEGGLGSGVESGLNLRVSGGPDTEFGYFLIGNETETMFPVVVSNGLLCLSITGGNGFQRYNIGGGPLDSIGQFDVNGDLVNLVGTATSNSGNLGYDVASSLPTGAMIMPGQTWHFQMWYRDGAMGAGSSNLTNGVSVMFL